MSFYSNLKAVSKGVGLPESIKSIVSYFGGTDKLECGVTGPYGILLRLSEKEAQRSYLIW